LLAKFRQTVTGLLLIIFFLLAAGCAAPTAEPVDQKPDSEETEAVQSYLIRGTIPAIPGEYKRTFNARSFSGYRPHAGPENRVNMLLLGFDSRGLSDAIVIVSYDKETYDGALLSLKRDTYVDFQTWSEPGMGHNALGWASYVGSGYGGSSYDSGAAFAVETVERLLDIEIHSYAGISFEGFVELIDQIGGVVLDIPSAFADRQGTRLTPGQRRLSGEEALIFARHRKNPRIPEPGSLSSDGDRVRRHHQLLQAILTQCKTLTTDKLMDVYDSLDNKLYTNMDDWDLLDLANILFNRDPRLLEQIVLPGEVKIVHEENINTDVEYYFLDFAECDRILTELGLK
jgi:LCP family protein required for cell wall assembly